jgi:hypothetical protein
MTISQIRDLVHTVKSLQLLVLFDTRTVKIAIGYTVDFTGIAAGGQLHKRAIGIHVVRYGYRLTHPTIAPPLRIIVTSSTHLSSSRCGLPIRDSEESG